MLQKEQTQQEDKFYQIYNSVKVNIYNTRERCYTITESNNFHEFTAVSKSFWIAISQTHNSCNFEQTLKLEKWKRCVLSQT